ncbi:MAG: tRNA-binding protein [Planctomycetota bacterium]
MSDDPEDAVDPLAAWSATDVRVGRVVEAEAFPEGRYSTHLLRIDLGPELGTRKSLARLVPHYAPEDLVGRLVLCNVGLEPRQIGRHRSEVLVLGVPDANGETVLVAPERDVPPGGRLH